MMTPLYPITATNPEALPRPLATLVGIWVAPDHTAVGRCQNGAWDMIRRIAGSTCAQTLPALLEASFPAPIPMWDAVACSAGPGSFTGIRIAAMVAQTLALRYHIPVIPIACIQNGERLAGLEAIWPVACAAFIQGQYTPPGVPIPLYLDSPFVPPCAS